jgi:hypothetical protein
VDACNPLLQAHPTWARDEHEGRGIPTSLTPASGRLASPPFALALALDPSGLGHAATLTRRPEGPPGLETPTISMPTSRGFQSLSCWISILRSYPRGFMLKIECFMLEHEDVSTSEPHFI